MRKLYLWAMSVNYGKVFLWRFRNSQERNAFIKGNSRVEAIASSHPEVRRTRRWLAQGKKIQFPVEII